MDTNDTSERKLQERIRAGDESAFDTLFRSHYAHLVRMAESVVRERALAEEVAQEVMLELWRRRETLRVEQTFRAYLLRSTRNRALNQVRHQRVVAREAAIAAIDSPSAPSVEEEMLGTELEQAVRAAIDALPEKCREVFQLSRDHGLRYAEIASTLEISVKTVEKRMGQALAELRDRLEQWLPGRPGGRGRNEKSGRREPA
ncbi:MAG TPA: RNA polymerase sigma-70 factor [Gemmatimonadaceae bacterium]|nr:RNA polymerase sigma-70 factor [Gemmatimonadaceae bacterium]